MVNITYSIISKLVRNNKALENNLNGVSYVMNKFMTQALGSDTFDENSFELVTVKDSSLKNEITINFDSGEIIEVSVDNTNDIHIEFSLDGEYIYSDFIFYKSGFNGSLEYTSNGIDNEDIYHVSKGLFKKIKKENGNKVYSVSAKSIGFYRSDRSSYELRQDYPIVHYNGVFDKVYDFFDSQVSVRETQFGPSDNTYNDLDNLLDIKLEKEKARARIRVPKK